MSEFREFIKSFGLDPPPHIEPGMFHKFPGLDKAPTNKAGWAKLLPDGRAGVFGDYSRGIKETWHAKRDTPMTPSEREEFNCQITEAIAQANSEREQKQKEVADKAASVWQAAQPAPADHPYLVRKGIKPHGLRIHEGCLVVPLRDGSELWSLQFIQDDGVKRFLSGGRKKGCYFSIGKLTGVLCIAEGFSTAASIYEATGHAVAVAMDKGNLRPVAEKLRAKLPDVKIILCADDDAKTEGNPGLTGAIEAADSVGGLVAIPDFADNRPEGATDFNDLAAVHGLQAVKAAIEGAKSPEQLNTAKVDADGWGEPVPLTVSIASEPYPLDALPDAIRAAVSEVQGFTQAPVSLVASSALAGLSLAAQAHANVSRAETLSGPVSLFLLTIADSGERKTTCDSYFTKAIREYQDAKAEEMQPVIKEHNAARGAWEARVTGVKEKIKSLAKDDKPTYEKQEELRVLQLEEPAAPKVPRLIYGDVTPEALGYGLATKWPTGAVISSEAGTVLGSHGMSSDSVMRNLALLNVLWDGGSMPVDRRSSESFTLKNVRLTVALQIQEATLRAFLCKSGTLARGSGFLARFLVAWPESTQGTRFYIDPPKGTPAVSAFNRRIAEMLNQSLPLDIYGGLVPPALVFSQEAKAAWTAFYNAIESELRSGNELYDVRDVASKAADNAARMAALFHLFKGDGGAIDIDSVESASRIVAWHLNEARRFYGELALPSEMADAARLDQWLIEYAKREAKSYESRRIIQKLVPSSHLRQKAALDRALTELEEANRVRCVVNGNQRGVLINPRLLREGSA